jgi:hypothetical protein
MSPEKSDRELIQETHDSVIELTAVVLGVKGQGGLIQDLQDVRHEVRMAVTEMRLTSEKGDTDVNTILNDVLEMKPKVNIIEQCLFGKDGKNGLRGKVNLHEEQIKTYNKATTIVWGLSGTILLALLGLLITHVMV